MAKIKNYVTKQNLAQYSVYLVDDNPNSTYFKLSQIPNILTGGKNAFLIEGSEFLKKTTEVLVEIIDSTGNAVYLKPIRNYIEGLSRVVSIEIYEDTPRGLATLTILGEATHDERGNPVPEEWRGKYNVKYTKVMAVEPVRPNTTYIRLYNQPQMTVREVVLPYKEYANIDGFLITEASGSQLNGIASAISRYTIDSGYTLFGWTLYKDTSTKETIENHTVKVISGSQRFKKEMIGGQYTASVEIPNSFTIASSSATTLAYDSFTDTEATPLASHSSDLGWNVWHVDPVAVQYYRISNNILTSSGIPPFSFLPNYASPAIATDNFTVYADIRAPAGNSHETGILLRCNSECGTFDELNAKSASYWGIAISPDHADNLDWVFVFQTKKNGLATDSSTLFSGSIQNITGSGVRLVVDVSGITTTTSIQPYGGGSTLYGPWTKEMTFAPNTGSSSADMTYGYFGIYSDARQNARWDNFTVLSSVTTISIPEIKVFSASILDVIDSTTMTLASPFRYNSVVYYEIFGTTGSRVVSNVLSKYSTTDYIIRYYSSSEGLVTVQSKSLAEVKLYNLTTFSGDVARAKYYVKGLERSIEGYQMIGNVLLDENELTLTQSIETGESQVQTGYFRNQNFADDYWFGGSIISSSYSGSY